ncbi:FAD-dependent oxidoreductase [Bordetella pertussis]
MPILQVAFLGLAQQAVRHRRGGRRQRATHFSFRHREDGGLTLAKSGRGTMHVVPDLLRYGMKFRSLYRARKANVRLSIGRQFFAQCWDEFRYFHLDRPPYARHRVLDPGPDMALVRSAYEDAGAVFPGMGSDLIDQAWAASSTTRQTASPSFPTWPGLPGLYLCTGFSGHGFSSSLGAGRCLAQWIARGRSDLSLDAFSYARLVDGRRLQPSILY